MIALWDYDSMIYWGCYKIITDEQIEVYKLNGKDDSFIDEEIISLSLNRLSQMETQVIEEIEDTGIVIDIIEYYVTKCKFSIRKWIYPEYKPRGKDEIRRRVGLVRTRLIDCGFVKYCDFFEADDIVADRAIELNEQSKDIPIHLIIGQDKDYNQIEGLRFNDSRPISKEVDNNGHRIKLPCKGLTFITKKEAEYNFWHQVLTGDSGDNIKGCEGIGKLKATKILKGRKNLLRATYEAYLKKYKDGAKFELWKNYFLIKLTTKR